MDGSAGAVLPRWLGGRTLSWFSAFSILSMLIHSCRGVLLSVLPLQALALFGDAHSVSVLYLCISALGVSASLAIPSLIKKIRTRGVFVIAAFLMCAAVFGLSLQVPVVFVIAMAAYVFAHAGLEITLNMYILDRIRRRDMGIFEPRRIVFSAAAYTVGPTLGVLLETRVGSWAPFAMTACIALGALTFVNLLGLRYAGAKETLARSTSPTKNMGRFFRQPRLRLAWFAAVTRSSWWAAFFVYTPILAVTSGFDKETGGLLVSAGSLFTFLAPYFGRLGRRYGLRRLYLVGYGLTGVMSACIWLLADSPTLACAMIIAAAFGASIIDGGGNVLFLRAVHPYERSEMAGVFVTYRDTSQLLSPAIASVLLRFAPVPALFLVAGGWMVTMAWFSRYVPRRM